MELNKKKLQLSKVKIIRNLLMIKNISSSKNITYKKCILRTGCIKYQTSKGFDRRRYVILSRRILTDATIWAREVVTEVTF